MNTRTIDEVMEQLDKLKNNVDICWVCLKDFL